MDRCDFPHMLLESTLNVLDKGSVLMVAIVLPFHAKVHIGTKKYTKWGTVNSRKPKSPFDLISASGHPPLSSLEERLVHFVEALVRVHPRLKGRLKTWTKLPYVSSGDLIYTHYTLKMALLVFHIDDDSPSSPSDTKESTTTSNSDTNKGSDSRSSSGGSSSGDRVVPLQCVNKNGDKIYNWLSTTLNQNIIKTPSSNTKTSSSAASSSSTSSTSSSVSSWGSVLDAGAGISSMCWLLHQNYQTITEITATKYGRYGAKGLRKILSNNGDSQNSQNDDVDVVVGNWKEDDFLNGQQFDVVVADYLLGAVERHWNYGQETMMHRLLNAVKPNGYLLFVGLEPYEIMLSRQNLKDNLVLMIESIGDAASLLAGVSTYRELPEEWVHSQVNRRGNEFRVIETKQFEMTLTEASLGRQLDYAKKMSLKIDDSSLSAAFVERVRGLREKLSGFGIHQKAKNYAMVIQRKKQ